VFSATSKLCFPERRFRKHAKRRIANEAEQYDDRQIAAADPSEEVAVADHVRVLVLAASPDSLKSQV
jgi:hypothetical protein